MICSLALGLFWKLNMDENTNQRLFPLPLGMFDVMTNQTCHPTMVEPPDTCLDNVNPHHQVNLKCGKLVWALSKRNLGPSGEMDQIRFPQSYKLGLIDVLQTIKRHILFIQQIEVNGEKVETAAVELSYNGCFCNKSISV